MFSPKKVSSFPLSGLKKDPQRNSPRRSCSETKNKEKNKGGKKSEEEQENEDAKENSSYYYTAAHLIQKGSSPGKAGKSPNPLEYARQLGNRLAIFTDAIKQEQDPIPIRGKNVATPRKGEDPLGPIRKGMSLDQNVIDDLQMKYGLVARTDAKTKQAKGEMLIQLSDAELTPEEASPKQAMSPNSKYPITHQLPPGTTFSRFYNNVRQGSYGVFREMGEKEDDIDVQVQPEPNLLDKSLSNLQKGDLYQVKYRPHPLGYTPQPRLRSGKSESLDPNSPNVLPKSLVEEKTLPGLDVDPMTGLLVEKQESFSLTETDDGNEQLLEESSSMTSLSHSPPQPPAAKPEAMASFRELFQKEADADPSERETYSLERSLQKEISNGDLIKAAESALKAEEKVEADFEELLRRSREASAALDRILFHQDSAVAESLAFDKQASEGSLDFRDREKELDMRLPFHGRNRRSMSFSSQTTKGGDSLQIDSSKDGRQDDDATDESFIILNKENEIRGPEDLSDLQNQEEETIKVNRESVGLVVESRRSSYAAIKLPTPEPEGRMVMYSKTESSNINFESAKQIQEYRPISLLSESKSGFHITRSGSETESSSTLLVPVPPSKPRDSAVPSAWGSGRSSVNLQTPKQPLPRQTTGKAKSQSEKILMKSVVRTCNMTPRTAGPMLVSRKSQERLRRQSSLNMTDMVPGSEIQNEYSESPESAHMFLPQSPPHSPRLYRRPSPAQRFMKNVMENMYTAKTPVPALQYLGMRGHTPMPALGFFDGERTGAFSPFRPSTRMRKTHLGSERTGGLSPFRPPTRMRKTFLEGERMGGISPFRPPTRLRKTSPPKRNLSRINSMLDKCEYQLICVSLEDEKLHLVDLSNDSDSFYRNWMAKKLQRVPADILGLVELKQDAETVAVVSQRKWDHIRRLAYKSSSVRPRDRGVACILQALTSNQDTNKKLHRGSNTVPISSIFKVHHGVLPDLGSREAVKKFLQEIFEFHWQPNDTHQFHMPSPSGLPQNQIFSPLVTPRKDTGSFYLPEGQSNTQLKISNFVPNNELRKFSNLYTLPQPVVSDLATAQSSILIIDDNDFYRRFLDRRVKGLARGAKTVVCNLADLSEECFWGGVGGPEISQWPQPNSVKMMDNGRIVPSTPGCPSPVSSILAQRTSPMTKCPVPPPAKKVPGLSSEDPATNPTHQQFRLHTFLGSADIIMVEQRLVEDISVRVVLEAFRQIKVGAQVPTHSYLHAVSQSRAGSPVSKESRAGFTPSPLRAHSTPLPTPGQTPRTPLEPQNQPSSRPKISHLLVCYSHHPEEDLNKETVKALQGQGFGWFLRDPLNDASSALTLVLQSLEDIHLGRISTK